MIPPRTDINPRVLLGAEPDGVIEAIGDDALDAVFIPTRGRPGYVAELWNELPNVVPTYVLPTSETDVPMVESNGSCLQILKSDDGEFLNVWTRMRHLTLRLLGDSCQEWDLPVKRSFALWSARRRGMRRVLFLDDDIRGAGNLCTGEGAAALSHHSIAGPFVDEFPDTSAVGHVARRMGVEIPTFLSGSCLLVDLEQVSGFFPRIYNEDWLFMVPALAERRVRSVGSIHQRPYDPFRSPGVGGFQEFGEVVADGVFAMLAEDRLEDRRDSRIWRALLRERMAWLEELLGRSNHERLRDVIRASLSEAMRIVPGDCVRFIDAWEEDVELWDRHLERACP